MAFSATAFNKLKLTEKYALLNDQGDFIASRKSESYFVHLFALNGQYIEMWMSIELNHLAWIEILNNNETLKLYANQFDFRKDLGLT